MVNFLEYYITYQCTNRITFEQVFDIIDNNKTGYIEYTDFKKSLEIFSKIDNINLEKYFYILSKNKLTINLDQMKKIYFNYSINIECILFKLYWLFKVKNRKLFNYFEMTPLKENFIKTLESSLKIITTFELEKIYEYICDKNKNKFEIKILDKILNENKFHDRSIICSILKELKFKKNWNLLEYYLSIEKNNSIEKEKMVDILTIDNAIKEKDVLIFLNNFEGIYISINDIIDYINFYKIEYINYDIIKYKFNMFNKFEYDYLGILKFFDFNENKFYKFKEFTQISKNIIYNEDNNHKFVFNSLDNDKDGKITETDVYNLFFKSESSCINYQSFCINTIKINLKKIHKFINLTKITLINSEAFYKILKQFNENINFINSLYLFLVINYKGSEIGINQLNNFINPEKNSENIDKYLHNLRHDYMKSSSHMNKIILLDLFIKKGKGNPLSKVKFFEFLEDLNYSKDYGICEKWFLKITEGKSSMSFDVLKNYLFKDLDFEYLKNKLKENNIEEYFNKYQRNNYINFDNMEKLLIDINMNISNSNKLFHYLNDSNNDKISFVEFMKIYPNSIIIKRNLKGFQELIDNLKEFFKEKRKNIFEFFSLYLFVNKNEMMEFFTTYNLCNINHGENFIDLFLDEKSNINLYLINYIIQYFGITKVEKNEISQILEKINSVLNQKNIHLSDYFNNKNLIDIDYFKPELLKLLDFKGSDILNKILDNYKDKNNLFNILDFQNDISTIKNNITFSKNIKRNESFYDKELQDKTDINNKSKQMINKIIDYFSKKKLENLSLYNHFKNFNNDDISRSKFKEIIGKEKIEINTNDLNLLLSFLIPLQEDSIKCEVFKKHFFMKEHLIKGNRDPVVKNVIEINILKNYDDKYNYYINFLMKKFDKSSKGFLNDREIESSLHYIGLFISGSEVKELKKKLFIDSNSKILLEEFACIIIFYIRQYFIKIKALKAKIKSIFNLYNINHDNTLDGHQFLNFLEDISNEDLRKSKNYFENDFFKIYDSLNYKNIKNYLLNLDITMRTNESKKLLILKIYGKYLKNLESYYDIFSLNDYKFLPFVSFKNDNNLIKIDKCLSYKNIFNNLEYCNDLESFIKLNLILNNLYVEKNIKTYLISLNNFSILNNENYIDTINNYESYTTSLNICLYNNIDKKIISNKIKMNNVTNKFKSKAFYVRIYDKDLNNLDLFVEVINNIKLKNSKEYIPISIGFFYQKINSINKIKNIKFYNGSYNNLLDRNKNKNKGCFFNICSAPKDYNLNLKLVKSNIRLNYMINDKFWIKEKDVSFYNTIFEIFIDSLKNSVPFNSFSFFNILKFIIKNKIIYNTLIELWNTYIIENKDIQPINLKNILKNIISSLYPIMSKKNIDIKSTIFELIIYNINEFSEKKFNQSVVENFKIDKFIN